MIVTLPLRRKTDLLQSDIVYFSIIKSTPAKQEVVLTQQQKRERERERETYTINCVDEKQLQKEVTSTNAIID